MAATVREIALNYKKAFSVEEITEELMKSSSISSPLNNHERDRQTLKKRVANELGRLVEKGLLVRERKGIYPTPGAKPEQYPVNPQEDGTDGIKLRILRTIINPLPIQLPLDLHEYVLIYPGDLIVVAGASNAGKTGFLLNLAWQNWDLFPIK